MASGDIYRLQQFFRVGSQLTENVIHFLETTSETDPDVPEAKHLIGGWHDKLLPLYAVDLFGTPSVLYAMTARRIDPIPGVPATVTFGGAEFAVIQGGGDGPLVPPQSAALVGLYSAHAGGTGRGRNYWPGVDVAAQADGQLFADRLAELEAIAAAMMTNTPADAPGTGVWKATIWSNKDTAHYAIVSAQARSNLATIRSRRSFPGIAV